VIRKIRNEQKERLRKGCFFMAEETVDAKTRNDATNTTSEESRTGVNPPVGERRRLQLKPRNAEAAARIEAERRQSLEKVGVATSRSVARPGCLSVVVVVVVLVVLVVLNYVIFLYFCGDEMGILIHTRGAQCDLAGKCVYWKSDLPWWWCL